MSEISTAAAQREQSILSELVVEGAKDTAILADALSRLIGQYERLMALPETESVAHYLRHDAPNHVRQARLALAAAGFGGENR